MRKFMFGLALTLLPFATQAQTPGAQPEFCVTSPSQTANYNQLCISASSSGGQLSINNFGSATGGLSLPGSVAFAGTVTFPSNIVINGAITSNLISNNTPATLGNWTKALNINLRNKTAVRVNLLGDSITYGSGGNTLSNSIGARLANALTEQGFTTAINIFSAAPSSTLQTAFDPRLTYTGTWGPWTQLTGSTFQATTAGATWTYTPGFSHDSVDIYWLRGGVSGGGNMIITLLDGSNFNWATFLATGGSAIASGGPVSTVTIAQSGTETVMKTTISYASAGSRALVITNGVSGNIEIWGTEAYNSTVGTIFIRDMGQPSFTSTLMVAAEERLAMLQMPAELVMLDIGRNDFAAGISTATYTANLATITANVQAGSSIGSLVYWTWPPSALSDTPLVTQQLYTNTFIAAAGTTIPVYNAWQRYENLGGQEALALSVSGYYNDTLHPSAYGNYDIGTWLLNALLKQPQAKLN